MPDPDLRYYSGSGWIRIPGKDIDSNAIPMGDHTIFVGRAIYAKHQEACLPCRQ